MNDLAGMSRASRQVMSRRQSLKTIAALGATASMAGCADIIPQDLGVAIAPTPLTDPAILNFALNLEYLEAEYYLRAVTGEGLGADLIGSFPGAVVGGRRVPFSNRFIRDLAEEIAADELAHVAFLRQAIVGDLLVEPSRPAINLRESFRAASAAAGLGADFDPFADELSFLLGAFIFEDVGVTAYKGASTLIASDAILESAAGILAVEGYHSGAIRTQLYIMGAGARRAANAISAARDALDGPADIDQGITDPAQPNIRANIVPSDDAAIAFSRTPEQVLKIVYLTPQDGVPAGGFFPEGVNGVVNFT
jgi:hypothetical protein